MPFNFVIAINEHTALYTAIVIFSCLYHKSMKILNTNFSPLNDCVIWLTNCSCFILVSEYYIVSM